MSTLTRIALLFCLIAPAFGQTETSSSRLYFAQIVDGGPSGGRWQTTFRFANPNSTAVSGTLYLIGNEGQDFSMNFGAGVTSAATFTVPARGTVVLQSQSGVSSTVSTGWAYAEASVSLQGVATYRFIQNGIPSSEVSVPSTRPTIAYFSPATAVLGIAVGNVYTSSLTLQVSAQSNTGVKYSGSMTVPALGHRSMNLKEIIPSIPSNFSATVTLSGLSG